MHAPCPCCTCASLDRLHPREGVQLALISIEVGRRPDRTAPLPDIDAPAVPAAGVSAPKGRSSKPALAAAQPETATP